MSTKIVCKNAVKAFSLLNELTKKIGAYSVSWKYREKPEFQCSKEPLLTWLNDNNLKFTSSDYRSETYECNEFVAFYIIEKEDDEK